MTDKAWEFARARNPVCPFILPIVRAEGGRQVLSDRKHAPGFSLKAPDLCLGPKCAFWFGKDDTGDCGLRLLIRDQLSSR